MKLFEPWANSHLYNWINMPNIDHKTLMTLLSTTVMCAPKLLNTISKWTVTCDVYESMYVEWKSNQSLFPPKTSRDWPNGTFFHLVQLLFTELNKYAKPLPPNLHRPSFNKCDVRRKTIKDSQEMKFSLWFLNKCMWRDDITSV